MKKLLLLSLLFVAVLGTASAQKVIVRTYLEKTYMSPKTGTSIGYENRFKWEFGGFFQESSLMESLVLDEEELGRLPRIYEKEFGGVYVSVPLTIRDKYAVKAQVRTGVTNGENFTITPSVLADYILSEHIRLGMGVGSRAFRPTLQVSASLSF